MAIPKVLHRIWLDDPMPEEFRKYGERWQELNPDWEIRDWRDSKCLPPLINQRLFDEAPAVCPKDWKRYQSDLLRLELLWLYGGVYIDTDAEPLKPLNPLIGSLSTGAFATYSPNHYYGRQLLTQFVLGAEPAHPWITRCINALPEATTKYAGRPLAQMIGPHHVTRVWESDPSDVTVLGHELFGPQSNKDRDSGRTPDLAQAYAWHRWANTRDNRKGGLR